MAPPPPPRTTPPPPLACERCGQFVPGFTTVCCLKEQTIISRQQTVVFSLPTPHAGRARLRFLMLASTTVFSLSLSLPQGLQGLQVGRRRVGKGLGATVLPSSRALQRASPIDPCTFSLPSPAHPPPIVVQPFRSIWWLATPTGEPPLGRLAFRPPAWERQSPTPDG